MKNMKLVKELHRRLEWLTFCVDYKELNVTEVKAILEQLEELDPLPAAAFSLEPEDAWRRFVERYPEYATRSED